MSSPVSPDTFHTSGRSLMLMVWTETFGTARFEASGYKSTWSKLGVEVRIRSRFDPCSVQRLTRPSTGRLGRGFAYIPNDVQPGANDDHLNNASR